MKVERCLIQLDRSAAELATDVTVLHQFNTHAAGICDPGLPGSIRAVFLLTDCHALALQGGDDGSQIFHFQTEMPDKRPISAGFVFFREDLDEGVVAGLKVEADAPARAREIEGFIHA